MNNPPEVNIAKMRKNRTLLADEVYRAAKGSSANRVFLWDLAKNLGIAEDEAKEIRAYYQDEGYFEKVSGGLVSLSDYGIARIEESILDSKAPADLVLDIRERQQLRVLLLKRLFEKTGVSTRKKVNLYDIAKGEGIAEGDISGFLNYLKHEGFIKFVGGAVWYYITDKGIDAVGELIEAQADDKQTSRFDQQSGNVQSVEIVPSQKLKVFLCHSSRNKPIVLELYDRLLADGVEPWLDVKNILGGQKWELEIKKAVRDSDAIIVCISKDAMDNKGYYHKEIKLVLDEADKQPEDHIFIIPLLLEECEIPERFRDIHCLNYQKPGSYESLLQSLQARAKQVERHGATVQITQTVVESAQQNELSKDQELEAADKITEWLKTKDIDKGEWIDFKDIADATGVEVWVIKECIGYAAGLAHLKVQEKMHNSVLLVRHWGGLG